MNLNDFKKLPKVIRYCHLYNEGIVLLSLPAGKHQKKVLYAVDSFFVEVEFNLKNKRVLSLKPLINQEQLSPYLDQISIKHLPL
ncbi:MAG: hypothetical protein ACNS62_13015 [Candidatus Cyclobacteriaceae bacterium M3_2C_046]